MEPMIMAIESTDGPLLPDDVLQEVFRYIPTKELISVWRIVSTNWSNFASHLCRQRSVRLRSPRPHEIFNAPIGQVFLTSPPPFSSAILSLDSYYPECHAFSKHVVERFGEHLKTARVTTRLLHYAPFFETLRRTPNLVALEILPMSDSEGYPNPEEDSMFSREKIVLPALKSLKMVYEAKGHFMRILEMCFRDLAPQLDSIHLQLDTDSIRNAEFNRCAQLICSRYFPKTSLGLPLRSDCSDGWRILVARGPFEIQYLAVSSYDVQAEQLDMTLTFDLLRPFLANCLGLTSLSLEGFEKRSLTSRRCQVSAIPTLRKLQLCQVFHGREDGELQFEPFQARNFPSLTEVVVDCYAFCRDGELAIDVRQILDVGVEATDRFLGVTSLDVGWTRSATDWADIFPNVTKLRASLRSAEQLPTIFTNMTQVTELDVQLFQGVFFDLPQRIPSLPQLKTLTLRVDVLEDEIGNFSALSPLNLKLVYCKYELSDYCLSRLRNRHLSVELLRKKDDD